MRVYVCVCVGGGACVCVEGVYGEGGCVCVSVWVEERV